MRKKRIDDDAFAVAWQAAASLDEIAAATGRSRTAVSVIASRLRRAGMELKSFRARGVRPESTSDRAAHDAHELRLTYREAAARHGVTHQAVQQAYALLYPGEDPPVGCAGDSTARAVAVELSAAGRPDNEVATEVGFCAPYVGKIRREAGINLMKKKDAAMRVAIEAVRAGAPAARAAADHSVSYHRLADRCRLVGVKLRGNRGERNGLAVAAADLVEQEKVTVAEAARRVGCTDPAVHIVLKRRRAG